MDFILGSFVSIAAIYFANKTINNKIATNKIQVPQ